jgi:hypothetical protein
MTGKGFGLYETDIVAWADQQADALHRRAANEIDWDNVAEEIEGVGRSQEQELANRIRTVLEHLLRLEASPAKDPRAGRQITIVRSRADIANLLKGSRTLRASLGAVIADELPVAREIAALALAAYGEAPRVLLDQLSYTEEQVLGPWLPAAE